MATAGQGASPAAPALLASSIVQGYLAQYERQQWPEATRLTLIYGILALQQQLQPGAALTLQQLQEMVQAAAAGSVVQRGVPQLQRQILRLQAELDDVYDRLALQRTQGDAATLPEQQHVDGGGSVLAGAPGGAPGRAPRRFDSASPSRLALKPPCAWRQGEPSGYAPAPFTGHPLRRSQDNQGATDPIYPDWWLSGDQLQHEQPPPQPRAAVRPQPRLAYSLPLQRSAAEGGGAQQRVGQAAHGPAGRGAPGAARPADGPGPRGRPRVRHAESRIKQAVQASRRQAAERLQRRQQLLAAAVAPAGRAPLPGQEPAGGAEPCAAAAAAEQFLANPWASWFVSGERPGVRSGPRANGEGCGSGSDAGTDVALGPSGLDSGGSSPPSSGGSCRGSGSSSSLGGASPRRLGLQLSEAAAANAGAEAKAARAQRRPLLDVTLSLNEPAGSVAPPKQPRDAALAPAPAAGSSPAGGGSEGRLGPRAPWAADYGHLDSLALEPLAAGGSTGAAQARRHHHVRQRQTWSSNWVGDFGHLEGPRFTSHTAFSHHQLHSEPEEGQGQGSEGSAAAARPGGVLVVSAELQRLVAAASRPPRSGAASGGDAGVEASAAAEGLGTQLADLLRRWGQELRQEQSEGGGGDEEDGEEGQQRQQQQQAVPAAAAAGSPDRLRGEQTSTGSPARSPAPGAGTAEGAGSKPCSPVGEASAASCAATVPPGPPVDADAYLAGLEDTSAMLQQALQQHSSLMQLIAGLGSRGGSDTGQQPGSKGLDEDGAGGSE